MGIRVIKAADLTDIFNSTIRTYHIVDDPYQSMENPFDPTAIEHTVYQKCWIDTVQWHYEDLIRDPLINPEDGMKLKRKIDASNQLRTDVVEEIDDYFLKLFKDNGTQTSKLNTESPAWVVDRLSILALKIYHMEEQANRADAPEELRTKSQVRLNVLLEQREDLSSAFDELMEDYHSQLIFLQILQGGSQQVQGLRQM